MRFIPAAVALALQGCASVAQLSTARSLADGQGQTTLAATGLGAVHGQKATASPGLEYSYRRGLGEGLDYGFRAWGLGLALDFKQELARDGAFTLSVSPQAGAFAVLPHATGAVFAAVSLPMGRALGANEVSLAPRLILQAQQPARTDDPSGSVALLAGGTLGASLELSPGVKMVPELTALWTAAAAGGFAPLSRSAQVEYGQGALIIQAALGVAFGR